MGSATDLNRAPTNPVVDLVSYGGGIAHGPLPTSASRSAPDELTHVPFVGFATKGKTTRTPPEGTKGRASGTLRRVHRNYFLYEGSGWGTCWPQRGFSGN